MNTKTTKQTAADLGKTLSVTEMRARVWKLRDGIQGATTKNGTPLEADGGKLDSWNTKTGIARVTWQWNKGYATANCTTTTRNLSDLIEA